VNSNPPSTRWSQCSKDRLQESYGDQLDYCLHNVPQTVYDESADCGNGIVDEGEECDCGNADVSVRRFFWLHSVQKKSSPPYTVYAVSLRRLCLQTVRNTPSAIISVQEFPDFRISPQFLFALSIYV